MSTRSKKALRAALDPVTRAASVARAKEELRKRRARERATIRSRVNQGGVAARKHGRQ